MTAVLDFYHACVCACVMCLQKVAGVRSRRAAKCQRALVSFLVPRPSVAAAPARTRRARRLLIGARGLLCSNSGGLEQRIFLDD